MADAKISALSAVTALAAGDLFAVDDVSDTTQAASGSTRKVTWANVIPANQYCIVNLTSGQTITNSTLTAIAWTSERSDVQGWHAASSSDIVVPVGVYIVTVQVGWTANTSGDRYHHLEVDESGSTRIIAAYACEGSTASGEATGTMSMMYVASAAATFRVQVFQDSGSSRVFGPLNRPLASGGFSNTAEFSVVRIA